MSLRSLRFGIVALVVAACSTADPKTQSITPSTPPVIEAYVAHVDPRLGVPSFVWISRRNLPRFESAEESAKTTMAGLAPTFTLEPRAIATVGDAEIHDVGKGSIIARWKQHVGGLEVFRGALSLVMNRSFEPIAASGFLAPSLAGASDAFVLDSREALDAAWATVPDHAQNPALARLGFASDDERWTARELSEPARVKKVLFPKRGALEPAYYVELMFARGGAWSYVVSAKDGRVVFTNDLVRRDAFTYRAWAHADTMIPMVGPQGDAFDPHPTAKPDGTPLTYTPSELVTLANYPFSRNDPWLAPGATDSAGNNVDAYDDRNAPDGYTPQAGDTRANVTSASTFDLPYDTSLDPGASAGQIEASVTQMFYVTNFLHDWYYDSGFDEKSGNHQFDNFGRGGLGNDRLLAEVQDYSGTNNSDAATPADGSSPRLQMFVFSGTSASELDVQTPASIAGKKTTGIASFGTDHFDLSGAVVLGVDGQGPDSNDGCETLNDATGKIVLVHRGTCSFVQKAEMVQAAGGIGVIVANVAASAQPTIAPLLGGTATDVNIPSLSLNLADGQALEAAIASGPTVEMKRVLQTDLDGALDTTIVSHEWGHVLSNRLISDGNGLTTNQSGGLGEGWADTSAMILSVRPSNLANPTDANWGGAYVEGQYAMSGQADIYYGVRRVPYSTDMTKDPLTLKHIQNGTPLPTDVPISFGEDGSFNAEVHNTGEVWATMFWECYAALLNAHGFQDAQDWMKRYLVASLKLTPPDPTIIEARDAVLAAVYAADAGDFTLFWKAYAKRGAGIGASGPPKDSADNVGVVESFDVGSAVEVLSTSLSDDVISCDHDGILDPGEIGNLKLAVKNAGTDALTAPTVTLSTTTPGITIVGAATTAIAALAPFETTNVKIPIGLAGQTSDQSVAIDITITDPSITAPHVAHLVIPTHFAADEGAKSSATDDVDEAHTAWTPGGTDTDGLTTPWTHKFDGSNGFWSIADAFEVSDHQLVSPRFTIDGTTFSLSFKHRWSFRINTRRLVDSDGGVIEVSTDGGTLWTDVSTYGKVDYNSMLDTGGRGDNPLKGRAAYGNKSAGYPDQWITSKIDVTLPTHPIDVRIQFRTSSGTSFSGAPGWDVDQIALTGISSTPFWSYVPHADNCDPNAPDANAGLPKKVPARTSVKLVGSGAGTTDAPLVFEWTQVAGPTVEATGADTSTLSFIAPDVATDTTFTFVLRTHDDKLLSPASSVDVVVTPFTASLSAGGSGCNMGPTSSRSNAWWLAAIAAIVLRRRAISGSRAGERSRRSPGSARSS